MTAAVPPPAQIDELAVGVELKLLGGRVTDVQRPRAPVAIQAFELRCPHPPLARSSVEDLEVFGMAGRRAHDERAERVGLRLARPPLAVDELGRRVSEREVNTVPGVHGRAPGKLVRSVLLELRLAPDDQRVVAADRALEPVPMPADPGPHLAVVEACSN